MADESLAAGRSRRSRSDKSGRLAALENLKAVKSGRKKVYDVIEDDKDLYEEISEEEYNRRVNERREEFVVGGGDYRDDGYEIFDKECDEAEEQEDRQKKKVSYKAPKSNQEKRQDAAKSGNIRSMFLSAPHKRRAETATLEDDDLLKQIMQSKGLDDDDDDIPKSNAIKRQKSESATPTNPFGKKTAASAPTNSKPAEAPKTKTASVKAKNVTPSSVSKIRSPVVEDNTVEEVQSVEPEDAVSPIESIENLPDVQRATEHQMDVEIKQEVESQPVEIKQEKIEPAEPVKKSIKEFKFEALNETDYGPAVEQKPLAGLPVNMPSYTNTAGEQVFRMFWLDAHEDPYNNPGTIHLFGKTEVNGLFVSTSLVVKNISRKLFFLPREQKTDDGTSSPMPFKEVYDEVTAIMKQHGAKEFRCKESTKKYVFFTREVPREANYLEVQYNPGKAFRTLPSDLTGRTFSRVFGCGTPSLETFILDRKLKGPSWLEIKNPKLASIKSTTCKYEIECLDPKDVNLSDKQPDPPSLTVLTLQARVVRNEKNGRDEVVMVGGLVHEAYPLTKPPPPKLFNSHFCMLAAFGERGLPYDFKSEISAEKIHISPCDNERMLISQLNAKMTKIDPDVVLGHDATGFTIPALLTAMERHKIVKPSALSKLNRNAIHHVNVAKMDRSHLLPGRIVCDTKLSAKELIQAKSYELCDLVSDIFTADHQEVPVDAIREMFTKSSTLRQLCHHLMAECQFVMKLLAELNVMPLATQITNICGNTLTQTLQKGRALRNEYLLLHAFTDKDFIVPDKETRRNRKNKDDSEASKEKKGPAYSGGLVLDPIVGFYDTMVLLMDFNSLYPSIIQEYNLCFTTCILSPPDDNLTAAENDWEAQLPQANVETGVLPLEIKRLVESRRAVKALLKDPSLTKEKILQYDIRQKALKLTANSMYGCLGFQGSRFYAKPIAALITQRGRDILMGAKSMAESLGHSIIYGDTDSIMINTGTRQVQQVHEIGNKIRRAINKQYKQLEIEIDGIFKAMLLLKKKKYAACTLKLAPDGAVIGQKIEVKGLDIVRRDWSELSRKTGRFIVDTLLNGELGADDAVEAVHSHLRQVSKSINEGLLPFEDFTITKQLTRNVQDYADAKNQSHVIVAKRFNERGARKLRAGDTVQYVICVDGTDKPHTQRAYSKDEMDSKEFSGSLAIDKEYYLSQQIFPVVTRLIEPIRGTDASLVAECLGLDPKKYNKRQAFDPVEAVNSELNTGISLLLPQSLDSDLFQNVEAFTVDCVNCKTSISVDGPVFMVVDGNLKFLFSECGHCHVKLFSQMDQLCNQVTRRLQSLQEEAENVVYICQMCDRESGDVLCNIHEEELPPCQGCGEDALQLRTQLFQSYAQLRYWRFMFDIDYYVSKFSAEEINKQILDCAETRSVCGRFCGLLDAFLKDNGFKSFALKSYMSNLPHCAFTRRPRVCPDLDIP